MSAGLARNWWAVALRGVAAVVFGLGIILLPPPTLASLVLLFAAYVVADGILAILAATREASRGERWWTLIFEGLTNLTAAGAVLVWAAIAVVSLASAWAVVSGALMLAAAHRLSRGHGRWLLVFGGGVSSGWGALAAALASSSRGDLRTTEWWLVTYALAFGVTLVVLATHLRRRHREVGLKQRSA
jgi:uncharacterized membrane protein HdeD (DUF308 family)